METGISLKKSIEENIDREVHGYLVGARLAPELALSPSKRASVIRAFSEIARREPAISGADWFSNAWIAATADGAPRAFDSAVDRRRELLKGAFTRRDAARHTQNRTRATKEERRQAEQQKRKAKREIELLLNTGDATESDYYPYRYLATEGFLPGYNFPRLPLRAFLNVRTHALVLDRPRFLGLNEIAPGLVISHESQKYRVTATKLPASGIEDRIANARLCLRCGYLHTGDDGPVELCLGCGVVLDRHPLPLRAGRDAAALDRRRRE